MTAVLFTRKTSVYQSLGGDCWDADRDARLWLGYGPIVAHPPCRAWGRLRQFAKPRVDEAALGLWAVQTVRAFGGVLEHPAESRLFYAARCSRPGELPDEWGGFTLAVNQGDFGHRAPKPTWLYIVGVNPFDLVLPPPRVALARVENMCRAERERTPPEFARFLLDICDRVRAVRGLSIPPNGTPH